MNFFKQRREQLDKTQLQIAIELGMTPAAVSTWENGQPPRLNIASKLAKTYQVTEERITKEIVSMTKQASAA